MYHTCKYFFLLLVLFVSTSFIGLEKLNIYPEKEYGEMAVYGTRSELVNFMEFKSGDVCADIGGGDGTYAAIYSLLSDSVTFYVEDISKHKLNKRKLNRNLRHIEKVKGSKINNTYKIAIGTFKTSNLPNGIFDKIIMKSSFHEFTYVEEMINDLDKKLKPGGKMYVIEAFSSEKQIIHCDEGHRGYRIREMDSMMARHGYYLTKMRSAETRFPNYANALVYEKDKKKSEIYALNRMQLEVWDLESKMLTQSTIASDPIATQQVCDSLKMKIEQLMKIYPCFQTYLNGFADWWITNKNFPAAINILKMNVRLFPVSYEATVKLSEGEKKYEKFKVQTAEK